MVDMYGRVDYCCAVPRRAAPAAAPPPDTGNVRPHRRAGTGGPKVLDKALGVLELFSEQRPEWTVTDVSRTLQIPFATTHRIMRSLEAHDFIQRGTSRRYRLAEGAVRLGRRAESALDLTARLAPALQRLWRDTDETSMIADLDERRLQARCIDRIEGNYHLRLSHDVGSLFPLHASAAGKALLAHLGDDIFNHVTASSLARCTERTLTDVERLRDDLAGVRERGYAFDNGELLEGAWGMAAPVSSHDGHVVATIGFTAPTVRLTPEIRDLGVRYVLDAARRATESLTR